MADDGYTSQTDQVEIAWCAWIARTQEEKDIPFAHVLGFAIQEAWIRFENAYNGFTNDNGDAE
ncbi:MAG: hypothetical protein HLUCCA12_13200 [Rhodobacteraceae bacterium HLUCCA12]|nr:MAG: hypothetical protein HLUCCA12_13200 [Rhodobacteraceae bacterium HLUCCA12]